MGLLEPVLFYALLFFAVPALMPGWRSLAAAVIVGSAILLLAVIDVKSDPTDDGAAQFLGIMALLLAIPSLACGALSGFLRLALAKHVTSLTGKAAIVLAPPAVLLVAFFIAEKLERAQRVPPDKACLDSAATFVIGSSRIEVPMLIALSLYPNRDGTEAMYLHNPWVMRTLCEAEESRQKSQTTPTRLSAVMLRPEHFDGAPEVYKRSVCERQPQPTWMKRSCMGDSPEFQVLQEAGVLSLPDIDTRFFGVRGTTYAEYVSAMERLQPLSAAGHFLRAREDKLQRAYLVAEPGYWTDASGAPVSATCSSPPDQTYMACRSVLSLRNGFILQFQFNARPDSFEVDFRAADAAARSFVAMLGLSED